jgi:hypothetical protein
MPRDKVTYVIPLKSHSRLGAIRANVATMKKIIVSAENYVLICQHALSLFEKPGVRLPDGRYEFPVDEEVLNRLQAIDSDMDVAVSKLFGRKEN